MRQLARCLWRGRIAIRQCFHKRHDGGFFVGGQTADDRSQDIRGQTAQTLAKIEKFLAEAGTDKSRLLTAQIWIKDLERDFAGMNEVWNAWTAPNAAPTRATAQCEMGAQDILVEIVVTAAVASSAAIGLSTWFIGGWGGDAPGRSSCAAAPP